MNIIKRLTVVFWVICCVLGGAIVFVVYAPSKTFQFDGFTKETEAIEPKQLEMALSTESFEVYEAAFSKQDVFQSLVGFVRGAEGAVEEADIPNFSGNGNFSIDKYRVVGIFIDHKSPQAVLEDVSNQTTLFVSIGDEVDAAIVQEILPGKIIFEFNGRKLVLVQ